MSWQSVLQVNVGAAGSVIQSIQSGSVTIGAAATTNTATITSVDTSKSILIWNGSTTTITGTNGTRFATRIALTNGTTVTATREDSNETVTVRFTVVEFASGVNSIQSGTIAMSTIQATNTATISAVGANAFVLWLGASTAVAALEWGATQGSVVLTNSTTVTASGLLTTAQTVSYMVVDLDSSIVQSVQAVVNTDTSANSSYTSTITSVTTGQTALFYNGFVNATGTSAFLNGALSQQLTNGTTVTLTRTGVSTNSRTFYFTVVQFAAAVINSIQRGTIAAGAGVTTTATITSVNTAKSFVNWGNTNGSAAGFITRLTTLTLTNATTVTQTVNTATGPTTAYEVVEFK